jgi:phage portal protein BeeE
MALKDTLQQFFPRLFGNSFFKFNPNYLLGSKQAVWLDVTKPYELYNSIPELRQVITKKALMFSNADVFLVVESNGKWERADDKVSKEFDTLISNPNVLQGMNDWLRNYKEQEQVYGNQFMLKNKPSSLSLFPQSLMNISPRYCAPYLSGKIFRQVDVNDIVLYYEFKDNNGRIDRFETQDILWSRINDLDNPLIGVSPIQSLKYPVTNIDFAYTYRNVILKEKGAIGMLSKDGRADAIGGSMMSKQDRDQLERQFAGSSSEYGIGENQKRVIITESALKWTPMTYPTKDLLLFEEIDADKITIIDHFGLNVNIFSSKSQTYENVRNSLKMVYTDTIIPEADQLAQSLGVFLGVPENYKIKFSYEHIPVLQDENLTGYNAIKIKAETIGFMVQQGLLSIEDGKKMLSNEIDSIMTQTV